MNYRDGYGAIDSDFDQLKTLSYRDVRINDKNLNGKLQQIGEYYLSIPTEDAFYEMRLKAGMDTQLGESLVHGNSWFGQGGIVLGQWLQAYSRYYAATGDERYLKKVREYVEQFDEVSQIVPDCCICNTAYAAEKIFNGLLDAVNYCGVNEAYAVCKRLLDNFRSIPAVANAKLRLGDNGGSKDETACEIEWYTLSESLYRFLSEAETRGEEHGYIEEVRSFARKFEYDKFWNIFLEKKDLFDYSPTAGQNTAYFHAYSHLNSFNSAMFIYEQTGQTKYLYAAQSFWRFLVEKQSLVTGGFGTMNEWLMPKTGIICAIRNNHCNFENQCNTYAVLRLSRYLAAATGDLTYGNLTELLYYNSFLASLETDEAGHAFYYSDFCEQGGSKWLSPISWTCCSGTRPLAALEILRNIWYIGHDDSVYVNLFVSSEVQTRNATVEMQSDFPNSDTVTFIVTPKQNGMNPALYIRKPQYLCAAATVSQSTEVFLQEENGQYKILMPLKKKVIFTIRFPLKIEECDIVSCGEGVRAFRYGPLALAAEFETAHEKSPQISSFGEKEENKVCFRLSDGVVFKPYMDYAADERYKIYFDLGKKE